MNVGNSVKSPGLVFVVSAPSGAGKRTVIERLHQIESGLVTTISATTRPRRPDEEHGRDYYFLSRAAFDEQAAQGAFLEWAEVHGNRYGTLKAELDRCVASGNDVIVELDVQGMRSLRARRNDVVSIFIMPPSLPELEQRLRKRKMNDAADMALRLENAREEIAARNEYDYVIVNDKVADAAAEMARIIREERRKHR